MNQDSKKLYKNKIKMCLKLKILDNSNSNDLLYLQKDNIQKKKN